MPLKQVTISPIDNNCALNPVETQEHFGIVYFLKKVSIFERDKMASVSIKSWIGKGVVMSCRS